MTETLGARIGEAIRRERQGQQLSVSELARRASVSKATISQLEAGTGNPSVETLWAIAGALGVPLSAFVEQPRSALTLIRAEDATPAQVPSRSAGYRVALLSASPPGVRRDIYAVHAEPGETKTSTPHPRGTVEHLIVQRGRVTAGPATEAIELQAGDYLCYPGDVAHVFTALEPDTAALIVMEQR